MRSSIAVIAVLLLAACGGDEPAGNDRKAPANDAAAPAAAGAGTASGAGIALQPGQWELRTEAVRISMSNMPAGATPPLPPPTTVNYCLTAEQARQPNGNFFTGGDSGNCRSDNMTMDGGRISGTIECRAEGATSRIEISGQFTPTSYEMHNRIHVTSQGMEMDMEGRNTGRRLGDCPA